MHAPTWRPESSGIGGTLVARGAAVTLGCAMVLVVGFVRERHCELLPIVTQDCAEGHAAAVADAHVPSLPAPTLWSPDFLEPLPPLQQASVSAATDCENQISKPLPFVPEREESYSGAEFPYEELPALVAPLNAEADDVVASPDVAPPPSESIAALAANARQPAEQASPLSEPIALPMEPAEFDEDAELAAQLTPQDLLTFSPAVAEISQKLLPDVRAAFALAQHGATHSARAKFVSVLRRIAQAKDVEAMTDRHSRALQDGLRALDEADDFTPAGGAMPVLELEAVAATHQTPMLKVHQSRYTLRHEAVALYHRYAQQKLGAAVAGEQAGSMALHGLGKIYARWAEMEEGRFDATRQSMTMYRAALVAHPRNHLAANELGVLLARAGRYDQAAVALEWAAQLAGTATIYRNLAVVQQHRGELTLAQAASEHAARLAMLERASGEVSRRHGVQWVAPHDLARVSDGQTAPPSATPATAVASPAVPRQSNMTPAPRGGAWQ